MCEFHVLVNVIASVNKIACFGIVLALVLMIWRVLVLLSVMVFAFGFVLVLVAFVLAVRRAAQRYRVVHRVTRKLLKQGRKLRVLTSLSVVPSAARQVEPTARSERLACRPLGHA